MFKEFLDKLGLTVEQVNQIEKAHKDEIDGKFIPKSRFDEVNEKAKTLKETVEARDKQLSDLKKFEGTNEELKKQLDDLKAENKTKSAEFEAQLKSERISNAVKASLTGKVHDLNLVTTLLDIKKVELNEDGSIKAGLSEQVEALQKDKAFLFTEAKKTDPNPNPGFKSKVPGGTEDQKKDEDAGVAFARAMGKGTAESAKASQTDAYFKPAAK